LEGGAGRVQLFPLPNRAIKVEDGLFLISRAGDDHTSPHPNGKGAIHFVHLGSPARLWDRALVKIYVYRLEGVQMKSLAARPQHGHEDDRRGRER
jgi:hypothetical protein